jgi:hypothetical protein
MVEMTTDELRVSQGWGHRFDQPSNQPTASDYQVRADTAPGPHTERTSV